MLSEDDIRLIVGIHGWKVALRRLHPDNPIYSVTIYRYRRKHCLGLLGEVQQMEADVLITLVLMYAQ